ncbi:EAL domain-containing protein [Planctomicrobium sp. SH527]|uniref:EAL domain-containing protein n=1 Tax=Planctomicrobium sp. SH527 TaxID=3448123 RepID=UPI003F5B3DEB
MQSIMLPSATSSSAKSRDGWYLVGCLPPLRKLTHIKIDSAAFVIGRRADADLSIASQCVSARHAEILHIGPHLFLRDLGSTNGTYLNRRQVTDPVPVAVGDHIEIANVEFRLEYRPAEQSRNPADLDSLKKTSQAIDIIESDWVLSQLNQLLESGAVNPSYQPIRRLEQGRIVGFEALARTSLVGLENPAEMFRTAEMVNREVELSELCRRKALSNAAFIPNNGLLFVNTHCNETLNLDVLPSLIELKKQYPNRKVVIEIHEGAIIDSSLTIEFCKAVRSLGFQIAYDDFGAGQSRLLELAKAPPDYLKFDSCLIRDVNQANPYQWRMLKMLVDMCHEVSITTIAEGVETEEELAACRELGFDFGQGYFLGKPKPPAEYVKMVECPTMKFR